MSARRNVAVIALCAVQFVDVLGVTVVITALPTMLVDLHASAAAASLVVTGYAMFFGGMLVLGARAGDRFGHRRVLQIGIGVFAAASIVAGFAPSVVLLVVGRCLQGAAAAVSVPAALRLLSAVTATEQARRRSLALWSASGAAAGATGFVLGGVVTQFGTWRLIFWISIGLALLLALTIRRTVPADPGDRGQRLDVTGAAVLIATVMALVLGTARLEEPDGRAFGAGIVVVGVLLVPVLLRVESRAGAPLLPPAALAHRGLRSGAVGAFLNTATTSSAVTLATLHLQVDAGLSPNGAGLLLLPFSLGVVLGATAAARLVQRWSLRILAATGLLCIVIGDLGLVVTAGAVAAVPVCMAIAGVGIGLSSVATTTLGTDVPPALQGVGSGIVNTTAQLGTALGIAAILLASSSAAAVWGPVNGARIGWSCAAALAAAGALFLLVTQRSCRFRDDQASV